MTTDTKPLSERLRNVQRHFSDPGSSHRATVTEAIAALAASNDRVAELEREAAQWQAAAGQSLVRAEALEDRLETVERERDEAKDEGVNFVFDYLAAALGLAGWAGEDGSETWDGDVCATLMRILRDSRVIDSETGTLAADALAAAEAELARLQSVQPAGDRPESVEAMTELQAAYGLLWRIRTTDKAIHEARHSLLRAIGKEGQRAGLEWALRTFGPRNDPTMEDLP